MAGAAAGRAAGAVAAAGVGAAVGAGAAVGVEAAGEEMMAWCTKEGGRRPREKF